MEMKDMIPRINALAKKKREGGLTPEETAEQMALYKEYLANIRGQVKQQLDNIEVVDDVEAAKAAQAKAMEAKITEELKH